MLELWRMRNTPSLPSLSGPLSPGVVERNRVLSMGQIELNSVLMQNWIVWKRYVFNIQTAYLCQIESFEIKLFLTIPAVVVVVLVVSHLSSDQAQHCLILQILRELVISREQVISMGLDLIGGLFTPNMEFNGLK